MMKNKTGKTLLLALIIFSLTAVTLTAVNYKDPTSSSYTVHLGKSFEKYTASQWKQYEKSWVYNPGDKLILHFSTLTLEFPPLSEAGGKISHATFDVVLPTNLILTGTGVNGQEITSTLSLVVLPQMPNGTLENGNFLQKMVSGVNNVGGEVGINGKTNDFLIFFVTERPSSDFKLDQAMTLSGDFGSFSFFTQDKGGSDKIVKYSVNGSNETPIANGHDEIDTGYGDWVYEEKLIPYYEMEINQKSYNITSNAVNEPEEFVQLRSRTKNVENVFIRFTFTSANDFCLVSDQTEKKIPYGIHAKVANTSTFGSATTAVSSSTLRQDDITQILEMPTWILGVKLNPEGGSLKNYPAANYSDIITITLTTDS